MLYVLYYIMKLYLNYKIQRTKVAKKYKRRETRNSYQTSSIFISSVHET